jgi:hypothetical protein
MPETTADEEPIVAIEVFAALHVPEPASVNADVKPTQTTTLPVIAGGSGLTLTAAIAVQPTGVVYVIVAVPVAIPETIPAVLTDATEVLLLLHVPPAVASLNVTVLPAQTDDEF